MASEKRSVRLCDWSCTAEKYYKKTPITTAVMEIICVRSGYVCEMLTSRK